MFFLRMPGPFARKMRPIVIAIMEASDYLLTQFPRQTLYTEFDSFADGTKRQAYRALKIFDRFMTERFGNQPISYDHLVCYMRYRSVGERIPDMNDRHNGACSLSTFRGSEISPLIKLLRKQGRVRFTSEDFTRSDVFKGAVANIKVFGLGSTGFTHARPLFKQDELRLRKSLTFDTASIRDEAIIVLLRSCGARSASVTAVRWDRHLFEKSDGALEVSVPSCKTSYERVHRVILFSDDARVLRKWTACRRTMFPENPFLFITMKGTVYDTNDITQMLYKLGMCSGYGPKFFSSDSFRTGYANRVAAEVYANGGSLQQAVDLLYTRSMWARNTKAVHNYIDPNLPTFFGEGYGYKMQEFESLCPSDIHSLITLGPHQRRPLTWFHHDPERIRFLCEKLGIPYFNDQRKCRAAIGGAIEGMNIGFSEFIDEVVSKSGKGRGLVITEAVGCLLQDEWIEAVRWIKPEFRDEFMSILCVKSVPNETLLKTRLGQQTQIHKLIDIEQARWVQDTLHRRPYDRMVHLGRFRNGLLVKLKVRDIEAEVEQIRSLPWFDASIHFPERHFTTPRRSTDVRIPITPSTAASTPWQMTGNCHEQRVSQ